MSDRDDDQPFPPVSAPPLSAPPGTSEPPVTSPPAAGSPPGTTPPPTEPELPLVSEDTDERLGDPFEGWPAAESAAVIEESPTDGPSVEHVRGEVDVPSGFTVLEGTPL